MPTPPPLAPDPWLVGPPRKSQFARRRPQGFPLLQKSHTAATHSMGANCGDGHKRRVGCALGTFGVQLEYIRAFAFLLILLFWDSRHHNWAVRCLEMPAGTILPTPPFPPVARVLGRRPGVHRQPRRCGLQHEPHRGVDRRQPAAMSPRPRSRWSHLVTHEVTPSHARPSPVSHVVHAVTRSRAQPRPVMP